MGRRPAGRDSYIFPFPSDTRAAKISFPTPGVAWGRYTSLAGPQVPRLQKEGMEPDVCGLW